MQVLYRIRLAFAIHGLLRDSAGVELTSSGNLMCAADAGYSFSRTSRYLKNMRGSVPVLTGGWQTVSSPSLSASK